MLAAAAQAALGDFLLNLYSPCDMRNSVSLEENDSSFQAVLQPHPGDCRLLKK